MDSNRFDNWTRNRAVRLSRRNALRMMAITGATAALPSVLSDAMAQSNCSLTIHAETAGGPSAPAIYDGVLQFSLQADGSLSDASFTAQGGAPQPAKGVAIGRALDVQISLPGNQLLILSGAGDDPVATCSGAAGGIFSGPQPGDLGVWTATSGAASALTAPVVTSGQSSSSSSSPSNSSSSSSCPPPQVACGQNCCPGGATCTNAALGLCACPGGTEQCGTNCVPSCPDGQFLDLDSCTCSDEEAACIVNLQTCQNHGQCCSGYCGGGTCFDCAGKVCGDFGCVDPSRDPQNCGNCGNVCIAPQVCSNGVCGCAPDETPCVDHAECCSQLCRLNICITCSDVTSGNTGLPLTFCGEGICVILDSDIDHCGACFNACPRTSGGIVCDTGVCHDINSDPNYCGFGAEVCAAGQICYQGHCINS